MASDIEQLPGGDPGAVLKLVTATEAHLTADEARSLVSAIRANLEDLKTSVVKAYKGRAWQALGYTSWETFCKEEFGAVIPLSERGEIVLHLRDEGLSLRAIAAVTGVSKDTVARELPTVSNETVGPPPQATITGLNGKTYTPRPAVIDAEVVTDSLDADETLSPSQRYERDRYAARDAYAARVIKERLEVETKRARDIERPNCLKGTPIEAPTVWMQRQMDLLVSMAQAMVKDGDTSPPERINSRKWAPRQWAQPYAFYMEHCDPAVLSENLREFVEAIGVLDEFKEAICELCGDECIQLPEGAE